MAQSREVRSVSSSSSSGSTASAARDRANRANARKSTGPRTAAGRQRSSRNAVTHGIFCKDAVLPGERQREFTAFRNLLLASPGLRPQNALELSIADQYVLAKWKLRRTLAAEEVVHRHIALSLEDVARLPVAELADLLLDREHRMSDERRDAMHDDARDGDSEGDAFADHADDDDAGARVARVKAMVGPILAMARKSGIPPAATLAASFTTEQHDGAFERVGRYQHRLEHSAERALRELRQLRKDLGVEVSQLSTCPFLESYPEEDEEEEDMDERGRNNADEHNDDDAGPAGVFASASTVKTSSTTVHPTPQHAPVQNEPIAPQIVSGDDPNTSYAQGSRPIEIVTPMKLAPRRPDSP